MTKPKKPGRDRPLRILMLKGEAKRERRERRQDASARKKPRCECCLKQAVFAVQSLSPMAEDIFLCESCADHYKIPEDARRKLV